MKSNNESDGKNGEMAMSGFANRWIVAFCMTAIVMTTSACVGERAFFIVQNQVPESGCFIPATLSEVYRSTGLLDISVGEGYSMFPLVKNDLIPTVTEDEQPERNRLMMTGFDVKVSVGNAAGGASVPSALTDFSIPASGQMEPSEYRSAIVKIIPDALVPYLYVEDDTLRPRVNVSIKAVADHNGDTLRSAEFLYSVELCNGCLVTMLSECSADDDETVLPKNVCGIPQDAPLTCCPAPSRPSGIKCLTSEGG